MIISKPNEDGFVFVTGEQHKYFVIYDIEGELFPTVETAIEIFNRMDMSDCYGISIKRLWLIKGDYMVAAMFCGTHHNPKDKLKMKIIDVITHETFDVGYGSDH